MGEVVLPPHVSSSSRGRVKVPQGLGHAETWGAPPRYKQDRIHKH